MICTKCTISQPDVNFNWRNQSKNIRHRQCKTCQAKYDAIHHKLPGSRQKYALQFRERWGKKRDFVRTYLETHPCLDCTESDPVCLDFDHVRGEKLGNICDMVYSSCRLETIQREIEKCDVRCANCHRKITAKRRLLSLPALAR